MVFGKDCKQLYLDCFKLFFDYFNGKLIIPSVNGEPELSNFYVVSPQDMSSIWKCTGLGGGSFNKEFFCYCCECSNKYIAEFKIGDLRCGDCKRTNVDKCFCHPVTDSSRLMDLRNILDKHVASAEGDAKARLDNIKKKTKILTNPRIVNKDTNIDHIDYQIPEDDRKMEIQFKRRLEKELSLRLPEGSILASVLEGDIESKRSKLKQLLEEEMEVLEASRILDRHNSVSEGYAKLLCECAILCVLHAEMQMNEKLITVLFQSALKRYTDGDSKTQQALIQAVTDAMNTSVLGTDEVGKRGQWRFPISRETGNVENKSLSGTQSRKIATNLKKIVKVIFSEEFDQTNMSASKARADNAAKLLQWNQLIDSYVPMMELARKHKDFTDAEIDTFQSPFP